MQIYTDGSIISSNSPRAYVGSNGPAAGMVRFNTSTQQLEAFDGCYWINVDTDAVHLSMTATSLEAIKWAYKKMQDEQRIEDLAKTNVAVANALEVVKKAQEQLNIVSTLANVS